MGFKGFALNVFHNEVAGIVLFGVVCHSWEGWVVEMF